MADTSGSGSEQSEDDTSLMEEKEENEISTEAEDFDLDASSTSEDDSTDDNNADHIKTREELVKETIIKKYEQRQGKQLYIRFNEKLPEDEAEFQKKAKTLSPLIIKAHKPRQNYARFCLVDFNSKDERDTALKSIRDAVKRDESLKGTLVSIPRTEREDFVKELAEKKLKSIENKKAKARLKRASKAALRSKKFTSSVVVTNLPKNSSVTEIRKLFPNAVDIQMRLGKRSTFGGTIASITLPSTMEARAAVKNKMSLGGERLVIRYDTYKQKKHKTRKPKKGQKVKNIGPPTKKLKTSETGENE